MLEKITVNETRPKTDSKGNPIKDKDGKPVNTLNLQAMHASTEKKYNLYFNNCVEACQDATQTNTGINLPYEVDPRPNSYWNDLNRYVQWFNLPAAEKQKQIDAMVKKQRAEMAREPKY